MLPTDIVNWELLLVAKIQPLAEEKACLAQDGLGYLLVGHGTRRAEGQAQLRGVFDQFAKIVGPERAGYAYLELAKPDIRQAILALAEKGIRRFLTVPVLLFSAGHALEDIPKAVEQASGEFGVQCIGQTPSFSDHEAILKLSAHRYREAVCQESRCSELDCCQGLFCAQASMVMVGRGSSSSTATADMRKFVKKRIQLTPVAWYEVAFIHGQRPAVAEALDLLEAATPRLKVVQPHLLFEGLLSRDLESQVEARQAKNPDQTWVIAKVLGEDERLACALAEIATDKIRKICR